jgi:hypothetical protein
MKTNIVSSHTADSKPVKQEVNGTVILPPLVFPGPILKLERKQSVANNNRKQRVAKNGRWVHIHNISFFE